MTRVVARLDPPSSKSFAMSPLVVERDGKLEVTGFTEGSAHRGNDLDQNKLHELIAAGHATPASVETNFPPGASLVGIWIGRAFGALASEIGVEAPPLVVAMTTSDDEGSWGVTSVKDAWLYLDLWVGRALARFVKTAATDERRMIAKAMRWALPLDPRTLAASWSSAEQPARELQWQRQVVRGVSSASEQQMRALLEQTQRVPEPYQNLKVVAFSGGTGTHREAMVRTVTDARGWGRVSFRDAIVRRLAAGRVPSKAELMRTGQLAVDMEAMSLAVEVLGFAEAQSQKRIVAVDSVRHSKVAALLKWLAPNNLSRVAITAKTEVRVARLRDRHLDPDAILADPTEKELDVLEREADVNFADDADPIAVADQISALAG